MTETTPSPSPRWNTATKMVAAFTIIALVAAFLVKFQFILGPLLMAFILAYLFYPLADMLHRRAKMRWGLAVGLVYLVLVIILLGLLTAGGVGLVQQIQNLISLINRSIQQLPALFDQFAGQSYQIGPFEFDLENVRLETFRDQLLANAQALLGRAGGLVGTLAGRVAEEVGWTVFILIVSYFILAESGGLRERILHVSLPGYAEDMRRMSRELERVWNAFLRGQVILVSMAVVVYTIVLSVLGVHYALGVALLAGAARFVPYIGPAINWIVLFLVAYFQNFKLFDLPPLTYSLLVLGIAWIIDQIFDNYVSPRVMSQALKVHPAAVLVAAIVAASLIGLIGIVIAAPLLATLTLLGRYILRKMFDLDPWPPEEPPAAPPAPPAWLRLKGWVTALRQKRRRSK